MYELIQVAPHTWYIESPAKIGLFLVSEKEVILIDSGSDESAARKVKRHLDQQGWKLKAIYNTHSNADHIGGNQYLQKQTGCKIYAPKIEQAFTESPILEPSLLYGGYPPSVLRHKFLMAKPSQVRFLTSETLPEGLELLALPGHFLNMVGFRTSDDVLFVADCLSSQEVLEKYKIGFIYDVKAYLETLEKLKEMKAALFIPSHAKPSTDLNALIDFNIEQVKRIGEDILFFCQEPRSFEEILQYLFDLYSLKMTFEQYALVGSTIRSYLSWLADTNRLVPIIETNRWLWKAKEKNENSERENNER